MSRRPGMWARCWSACRRRPCGRTSSSGCAWRSLLATFRRGRHWSSPVGNLYSSTILRPDCQASRATELGFVAALAVADVVPTGRETRVKWPNDVMVDGGKVAGILLESSIGQGGLVEHVVAGIGINVGFAPQLPEMRYPGAALGGSVEATLEKLTQAMAQRLTDWRHHGFETAAACLAGMRPRAPPG